MDLYDSIWIDMVPPEFGKFIEPIEAVVGHGAGRGV